MGYDLISKINYCSYSGESNRDGIFSKSLVDVGCDNVPKSPKKRFLKKCGLRPFVFSQSISRSLMPNSAL